MTPNRPDLLDHPGIPAHACLSYDRNGRLILPDDDDYVTSFGAPAFQDDQLDAIDAAVFRRRRRWRFRFYGGLVLLVAGAVWTFVLMPLAALHLWPFK